MIIAISPAYGQYTPAVSLPGSWMARPLTPTPMDQEHFFKKKNNSLHIDHVDSFLISL